MKITGVERIELDIGFTPRTEPHMRRGITNFSLIEICRVTTDTGIVGWGESRAMHNWDRDMDAVDAGVQVDRHQPPAEKLRRQDRRARCQPPRATHPIPPMPQQRFGPS